MEPAVTVRGLYKSYGDRAVVDGIDFDVHAGEIVGMLGANGAGKTTTVECLQGLRRPDAGHLRVLGYDPTSEIERLRPLLGSQLQDSALPDRLRVAEAVDLFASGRATDHDGLLDRFGLGDLRRSPFAALSGGERQRLFLVLALLNRPRLVILDELTQGLDAAKRRDVWAAIGELRELGTTVLLVTHYLDEAELLCDRVIAMRAGRILDQGTPADLVARHARWATLTFSAPAPAGRGTMVDAGHEVLARLRRLPGVVDATLSPRSVANPAATGPQVTVWGDRTSVAHVGAELVAMGAVPADLHVSMPNLEDALIELLSTPAGASAPAQPASASPDRSGPELMGAAS